MKCLSLWQPWAQLVVLGLKGFETRPWRTHFRGPLLIHAARRRPPDVGDVGRDSGGFEDGGLASCYGGLASVGWSRDALPRGAIVGLVHVVDCHRTEDLIERLDPDELLRGNFAPGRFAWELEGHSRFARPHVTRGFQGLFDVPNGEGLVRFEAAR